MKQALIVYGGYEGHSPGAVAQYFEKLLIAMDFQVASYPTLTVLDSLDFLKQFQLFIPIWTMGELTELQAENVSQAIGAGMGIAGCHGGMCDAFRNNVLWQFITGGNWVSHPGDGQMTYTIHMSKSDNPLIQNIQDFEVTTEQYYLHIDPVVEVLATTRFPLFGGYHATNGPVDMPVIWTKKWGEGRVYYMSLGHDVEILEKPQVTELLKRGLEWAAQ